MRPGAGKQKGNDFENLIAKTLSLWLSDGMDKRQLIRAVSSGGWVGRKDSPEGFRQIGDLAPNGALGQTFREHFAVECKHQKSMEFWQLLSGTTSAEWLKWWPQIVTECRDPGRCSMEPLLIFRVNGRPIMCGMRSVLMEEIGASTFRPHMILALDSSLPSLLVFPFEQFLQHTPSFWYEIVRQRRAREERPW